MPQFMLLAALDLSPFVWIGLGLLAALGLLALFSPRRFASVATQGSKWIDINQAVAKLDKRVEVDHLILPFSRWLGLAVLASAVALGVLYGLYVAR